VPQEDSDGEMGIPRGLSTVDYIKDS
jgi:hypothetical protein